MGTMVVKTDVCHYSELKIYPGHGTKIITREGKIHIYLHKKARHQAQKKIKVQQIKWTTAWRRHNKKIKATDLTKKKRRRAKKVVREIEERRNKLAKANQANTKAAPQKQFVKNTKQK